MGPDSRSSINLAYLNFQDGGCVADFQIMYSCHNLDNTRCKIRGKSMENSNATYRHDLSHVQRSLCMRKARDLGLQACYNKLPVDVIVCVSLAVSCVRVNLPEFPGYFYCLIF